MAAVKTYGRLDYGADEDRGIRMYRVRAVPHVALQVKRLFPRADPSVPGVIIMHDTPAVARDLEWFMGRWPLQAGPATLAHLTAEADRHRQTEQAVFRIQEGWRPPDSGCALPIPARDYQLAADAIAAATGRLLNSDDIGLGKTFSSILRLRDPEALPALVVAPANLCGQWLRELGKFLPWLTGHVAVKGRPYDPGAMRGGSIRRPDVWIMSYSKLAGWSDHLAGDIRAVIFDEVHDLRTGQGTAKWAAAADIAWKAAFRIGCSVGPDSIVELVGGPFGCGWVGPIEAATQIAAKLAEAEHHGKHEIFRVAEMGIRSRGWTPDGFAWKQVKSFIRHSCTTSVSAIHAGGGVLTLTDDHSVYVADETDFRVLPASVVAAGDRLIGDNGRDWREVGETPVDVTAIASAMPGAQVVVDLSGITGHDIGVTGWQWRNFTREGKYGTRLPAALYRKHARLLPPPVAVYVSLGRGGRRVNACLRLSDWAYMLGFYLGGGWVEGTRVCFAVENERVDEFLDRMRHLPGADVDPSVQPMPGRRAEVRFGNPIIAAVIRGTAGPAKCYDTSIPGSWIVSWPARARRELLRGLLDSGGRVSRKADRRCFTTTSKRLADSILSLLRSLGITGSASAKLHGAGGLIGTRQITGKRLGYVVSWSAHAEAGDSTNWRRSRTRFGWTRGRLIEVPARACEPVSTADRPDTVYDLEMEGHPSFVANGLLVHNSATPVFNYGDEVWNIMEIIAPGELGSRDEFLREWCSGTAGLAGHHPVGDPAMLGEYLRDTGLMVARTRKQLHMELPDPILIEQPVDADHASIGEVAAQCAAQARVLAGEVAADFTARGRAFREIDWKMRQITGIAKAKYVAEFVKLLLQSEQRVVVWCWHREVYSVMLRELGAYRPAMYTGSESAAQKERSRAAFCGGESRVLLMSLRSGAGLDGLQGWCSVGVFAELDWSPEMHSQCIGRLARDGQPETVVAYFMTSEDGTDPLMCEVLGIKRQQAVPIRNPDAPLFEALTDTTDLARQLAASILARISAPAKYRALRGSSRPPTRPLVLAGGEGDLRRDSGQWLAR